MSSGADCSFYEKKDGWYYDIQQYPYGANEDYNTHGPFTTFRKADKHLGRNYANPGGYTTTPLPGCKHDLARPMSHPYNGWTHNCDRCGASFKKETVQ
jgi:hypothetical protein